MAKMGVPRTGAERRFRRHLRVRKKVEGTTERPRLVVFRSLKHVYAQIVDDQTHRTILTVDRAGYQYHGRVKAVADGAREGGLEF